VILRFLGHAAFALQAADTRLCVDPHRPGAVGGRLQLPAITGPFDAVAITHRHEDHAGWTPALGTADIIDEDRDIGPLQLRFRPVFHDAEAGLRMGLSSMLSMANGGLRIVHCGDIGAWDDDDLAWLAGTDLLLVPVGGTFTIGCVRAIELTAAVKPRWVMPMHGADPRVDLDLELAADFVSACGRPVHRADHFDAAAPPPDGACLVLTCP